MSEISRAVKSAATNCMSLQKRFHSSKSISLLDRIASPIAPSPLEYSLKSERRVSSCSARTSLTPCW
eukprot:1829067-Prymnesium_polylepis.1